LLRRWKQDDWLKQTEEDWRRDPTRRGQRLEHIKENLARERPDPQWYVNGQGQTMVVIPGPVTFLMGSPSDEGGRGLRESLHTRHIDRTFALAAKAVTVEQYRRFQKDHHYDEKNAPEQNCPVNLVTWHAAARYCNWLSEQEGIPPDQWCYELNAVGEVTRLKDKYLSLTGYRLPTEAEVEYACRAGAVACRYSFGGLELLDKYAWYQPNAQDHSWPVGTKKPNDLGLFDMHGNIWCWCQDRYQNYPASKPGQATNDLEDPNDISGIDMIHPRSYRGGCFGSPALELRCACRSDAAPLYGGVTIGFRPARTLR
jgi:formylglycine-generating enzyme required for sulfatase activity